MRRSVVPLVVVALALVTARSGAVPDGHVVSPNSRYLPGDGGVPVGTLALPKGSKLTYHNYDPLQPHTLTHRPKRGDPTLFDSGTLARGGASAEVKGVASLQRGTYPFYCVVHPEMVGTLQIVDA